MIGSWPIRWTPSRRRLAVSPISRSAGRFVGRFPIPKSLVSVMVVSVRGAFPYCLIVVFVVHVQARGDPGGDHPGPGTVPVSREGSGGSDGGRRRDRPDRGGRCRGCRG